MHDPWFWICECAYQANVGFFGLGLWVGLDGDVESLAVDEGLYCGGWWMVFGSWLHFLIFCVMAILTKTRFYSNSDKKT